MTTPLARTAHAIMLCFAFLLTCSIPTSAQVDFKKLKKKAEDAVKPGDAQPGKIEHKQTERVPAEAQTGEDPEEMLREAARAVMPLADIRSVYPGLYSSRKSAQEFYDLCKKTDYAAQRAKTERAVALSPELKDKRSFDYASVMTEFPKSFDALVTDFLIKEINGAIEKSYTLKAKGKGSIGEALESAEAAHLVASGILLVTPGDEKILKLQKDAQAAVDKMNSEFGASIYTSAFHREHKGQIVFWKKPAKIGQEDPAAARTSFTPADDIYGLVYFNATFKEATRGESYGYFALFVDGNEVTSYQFSLDASKRDQTYLVTEVLPDPAVSETRGALIFAKALANLSPRNHTVKIVCRDGYNTTLAEGEFEFDCSSGTDRIAEVVKKLETKKLAAVAMPTPAKRDAALEKSMLAAVGHWKEKPLKAVITDADWTIQRHPISGAIVSRTINATVAFKTAEGVCRLFKLSFIQKALGGKSFGKTEQYGVGDSMDIACENI